MQLLLDALAEDQQVGVSQEEFTERVLYNAQRLGVSPDEYFSRLQEGNQLGAVFAEVRRGKALAGAVEKATVTNTSGEVLDVAALFGVETVTDEERLAEALEEAQSAGESGLSVTEQVAAEELAEEIVSEAVAEELAAEIVDAEIVTEVEEEIAAEIEADIDAEIAPDESGPRN